jgi:hypothetical protein
MVLERNLKRPENQGRRRVSALISRGLPRSVSLGRARFRKVGEMSIDISRLISYFAFTCCHLKTQTQNFIDLLQHLYPSCSPDPFDPPSLDPYRLRPAPPRPPLPEPLSSPLPDDGTLLPRKTKSRPRTSRTLLIRWILPLRRLPRRSRSWKLRSRS